MNPCRFIGLLLLLPVIAFGAALEEIPASDQAKSFTVVAKKSNAIEQLIGLGNSLGLGQTAESFLPADEAFQFSADVRNVNTIALNWVIADGYYLYRDKFKIQLQNVQGIYVKEVEFPAGEVKEDEFFGRMEVYHNNVEAVATLERLDPQATEITLIATYQGCAEAGICYPPIERSIVLMLADASPPPAPVAATATAPVPKSPVAEQDLIAQKLLQENVLFTILSFLGFGLLLAFTPCVFPMIPILSSILVGQGGELTARRGFGLSLVYVIAMACTYTVAGVLAGLFGRNLQATFQNPWILSAFAGVFVLLALSMFGFYKLQIPAFIQDQITKISNRRKGGTIVGVAIMGFLSAMIIGPCVAAPLAGALIYIGQTGDAVLGGLALFALSVGMGIPLLALGAGAGKLLPKTGPWMNMINAVFGVLLLALAIWLLERILPASVSLALWAVLLIVSSVYMGSLDSLESGAGGWRRLWKGIGLVSLVCGVLLLVGAASGSKELLQPLRGLGLLTGTGEPAASESALAFHTIKSVADLEYELQKSAQNSQYVMLDFYADWCVTCKEMEKYTFSKQ
ncbi:MAG: protein-disulfide reductase DsbD, partial [Gammaproteobacteria bacterium]